MQIDIINRKTYSSPVDALKGRLKILVKGGKVYILILITLSFGTVIFAPILRSSKKIDMTSLLESISSHQVFLLTVTVLIIVTVIVFAAAIICNKQWKTTVEFSDIGFYIRKENANTSLISYRLISKILFLKNGQVTIFYKKETDSLYESSLYFYGYGDDKNKFHETLDKFIPRKKMFVGESILNVESVVSGGEE